MPVFNADAPVLRAAVASVAAQTYADRELVLVDDGSTDPATGAAPAAAGRAAGVTLCRTANRGTAAARNLAVERARGDYIVPLDADDSLAPAFLAETVPVLDARPEVGVVYTWVGLVGRHRGVWRTGGFTVPELLAQNTLHVTALYRRRVWEDVGGYDPRFAESAEDWDFWLAAAARGWQGACVPRVLAFYRRGPGGRELASRVPGTSARLMRLLVEKHRPLYERHLEDVLAAMYERTQRAGRSLERVYAHPVVRLAARLRGLLARSGPA